MEECYIMDTAAVDTASVYGKGVGWEDLRTTGLSSSQLGKLD